MYRRKHETNLQLPWLTRFDNHSPYLRAPVLVSMVKVPAGARLYEDMGRKRVSIVESNDDLRIWSDLGLLTGQPSKRFWHMEWRSAAGDDIKPAITIKPPVFGRFDGLPAGLVVNTDYDVTTQRFEGREQLFAEFVRLARTLELNPAGFPLKSGVYASEGTNVCVRLDFGEKGGEPRLEVVPESLSADLDFPYRTELRVINALQTKAGRVQSGEYDAEVTGFRIATGAVDAINCQGIGGSVTITGAEMISFLQSGQVEILNIVEDQMPRY